MMSLFNLFTKAKVTTKLPTVKQDALAYTNGAQKTYDSIYDDYVASVEALDKAIRVISNIASMATPEIFKDTNSALKPLKVKNIDFKYNVNDQDSASDLISMIFASIFTQGAAIILPELNKKTKFINFFSYDITRFRVDTTEARLIDKFVYTSEGGSEVPFKPEDVIYIAPRLSSSNLLYAVSRLKALNDMLTLQANLMKQSNEYYAAGGKQSAIISPKEPMGPDKANNLKTAFDAFLQTPATKTLFINTEVDVKTVSNAQNPTQIMEALTTVNTLVREQFGIPEYFFGTYQGYVNDAAVVTASRIFFQIHMKPVFKAIEYQFTKYMRNTLGLKDAVLVFNYKDVEILEDNLTAKIDNAGKLYKLGILSMNEARAQCELEALPDDAANRHFVPSYLTGQFPVSIEEFDQTLEKLFVSNSVTSNATGTTGGTDNANLINDSTGGAGNVGE